MFSVRFRRVRVRRRKKLFPLTSKPFQLNLWYLAQITYGSGEIHRMTFPRPWLKVMAVALINKNWLVCAIKWQPLIGSLQPLIGSFILTNFLLNFWMCFFKVRHYLGHISGMVGTIDVIRKGSALVGHLVQHTTLTFELTHDLDLGCFKVKFRNSSISGIVGLIDVKWKWSELIWYWADCMTLSFDHTHDLELGVSRSESEKL